MKKLFLILLFVSFIATNSYSQYQKAISVDPIDFLVSKVFNATYEQKLSPTNSFTIFASYYNYSEYWNAVGIGGSYRWYLTDLFPDTRTPLGGFSVGPMARISYWDYTEPNSSKSDNGGSLVVIGVETAYKFTFQNWFIEPILRIGFAANKIDYLGYDPLGGGINLGYAW